MWNKNVKQLTVHPNSCKYHDVTKQREVEHYEGILLNHKTGECRQSNTKEYVHTPY